MDNWCYFSVKGRGHSRNPGDSSLVSRVTIDLDRLTSIEILEGGTQACVSSGVTTIQVYSALESQNLSFVGGHVGSVGMGGFTLGRGTSPFSNKYGWLLDNVYEYEVCRRLILIFTVDHSVLRFKPGRSSERNRHQCLRDE